MPTTRASLDHGISTFGSDRTPNKLPCGRRAIESEALDFAGQSQKLQSTNTEPVYIDLIPTQTMLRRRWMSVMVVVPSFTERQQRYPPAIARIILSLKSLSAPQVCSRIDEPGRMKRECDTQKNSPQHYTPTAEY
jgi:hypothetical protein